MELPKLTDLTTKEKNAKVRISYEDSAPYEEFFHWPFETILKYTKTFPTPPPRNWTSQLGHENWDPR